jgi:hypothetical protein
MFYLFACTELDKQVKPKDALLVRHKNRSYCTHVGGTLNAIESYVMDSSDTIVWQSWEEEQAA